MDYIELDGKTLNRLHQTQVEILDEIVRICDKYSISYSLIGGTLLGAVRHKGFIPWDDDLDIVMPRNDYEKFISICEKELSNSFMLDNINTNKNYWLTFCKIRKKNTLFREKAIENIDTFKGIYVDIFVWDNLKKQKSFSQKIQIILIKSIMDSLFLKTGVNSDTSNCRRPYLVKILQIFSIKKLHLFNKKLCMKYNNLSTKYITVFSSPYNYNKEIMLKEKLFPLSKVKFEGKMYNAPNDTDYYLTKIYGDYMQLPPVEKRVNHSALEVIFDTTKKTKIKNKNTKF